MGFLVVALHDGELVENVGRVVAADAVEVEHEGVEPGHSVAAIVLVPGEGIAFVAEILGHGAEVDGGVAEAEDLVADEVGNGPTSDGLLVLLRRYDRELFDDVQVQVLALDLLAGQVVEGEGVEVGEQQGCDCARPGTWLPPRAPASS